MQGNKMNSDPRSPGTGAAAESGKSGRESPRSGFRRTLREIRNEIVVLWWSFFDWLAVVSWKKLLLVSFLTLVLASLLKHPEPFFMLIVASFIIKAIAGGKRKAVQYDIGNPLAASMMTRHQLAAALYAPLRVVLFEDEQGRGVFEYDRPTSLFSQYGDDRVTEVGRYLDATLEAVLRNAAD